MNTILQAFQLSLPPDTAMPITFSIQRGELAAVTGGQAFSLFKSLAGFQLPRSGSVLVDGCDLFKMEADCLRRFRRKYIGLIFPQDYLLPGLTILENIAFPLSLEGRFPDKTRLSQAAQLLGLTGKLDFLPRRLSRPDRQAAAMLRAILLKPKVILAWEPFDGLSAPEQQLLLKNLAITAREFYQTFLIFDKKSELSSVADRCLSFPAKRTGRHCHAL